MLFDFIMPIFWYVLRVFRVFMLCFTHIIISKQVNILFVNDKRANIKNIINILRRIIKYYYHSYILKQTTAYD
jgi:hypothetical protein